MLRKGVKALVIYLEREGPGEAGIFSDLVVSRRRRGKCWGTFGIIRGRSRAAPSKRRSLTGAGERRGGVNRQY
jgi:hypothetical protein